MKEKMKNTIRRVLSVFAAIAMVLGVIGANVTPVMAAGTGSITINPPTGSTGTNTYRIYKVFEADGNGTNISYKLLPGKSTSDTGWTSSGMGTYFDVDTSGNVTAKDAAKDSEGYLSAGAISAVKAYVEDDATTWPKSGTGTYVREVSSTSESVAKVDGVPNGYYYITTSTGSVVTIDSTNPDRTVRDKNTVPSVDKKITRANSVDEDGKKAIGALGTDVEFTATVTFGKGTKNVKFHDTMSSGLSFNGASSITVEGLNADQYQIQTTPDAGDTFTIQIIFTDGIAEGTKATIKYTAKVTSDALTVNPATNDAYLSYGDNNTTTTHSETEVYNAKFTVTKHNNHDQPLAGAKFVLKYSDGKYYKYDAATEGTGATNATVSWVADINSATVYTSDANGAVKDSSGREAFTGLANGTYTLVEIEAPSGYAKAADSTFTIKEHDYSQPNLEQSKTVENVPGSELPSTGGIGTTIFYVIGGVIVAGAVVLLIARRRKNA